jgi:hypothetical protein
VPVCCESASQFSYSELHPTKQYEFEVTETSPAYQFAEGKSFFKALRFPTVGPQGGLLTLRTYPVNTLWADSAHIFIPRVTVLNERKETVRSAALTFSHYVPRIIGNTHWEAQVPLEAGDTYVVIPHFLRDSSSAVMKNVVCPLFNLPWLPLPATIPSNFNTARLSARRPAAGASCGSDDAARCT